MKRPKRQPLATERSVHAICSVKDRLSPKGCTGPRPCPVHQPQQWMAVHTERAPAGEVHALGGVDTDNDTYEIHSGPLTFNVMELRNQGVPVPVIAQLYTDLIAVYRRWERRDLQGPHWGVVGRDGWLISGGDRDQGPRGLWTNNVDLAQRFDTIDEIPQWIEDIDGIFHPDYPRNLERVGLRVVRIR